MTVSIGWIESALTMLWVAWIIYWVVGEPLYQYAKHGSKEALKRGRTRSGPAIPRANMYFF